MPKGLGLRNRQSTNISINSVTSFIVKMVNRDNVEEFVAKVCTKHFTLISFLDFRIRDALHMIFPICRYIDTHGPTAETALADILSMMDRVYQPDYNTPSGTIRIVREAAIHVYFTVMNIDVCSIEAEKLLGETMDDCVLFNLIVEHFMETVPPGIVKHGKAGLFDVQSGVQVIAPSLPTESMFGNESRFTVLYSLFAMFMQREDQQEITPIHDMIALRGAMRSTISWRDGRVVERCRDAETLLRMAPDSDGVPCNPLQKCQFCDTFDAKVYSPECNHIVGCTVCLRNMTNKECSFCGASLCKVKVFMLIPSLGGMRDEEYIDAKHLCDRLVPGCALSETVYNNIASMKLDTESVIMAARYLARVTNKSENVIVNRATLYFSTNCTLRRDGDDSAWWRIVWYNNMYSYKFGTIDANNTVEQTVYSEDDSSEDENSSDEENGFVGDIRLGEEVVISTTINTGRATLTPIHEYVLKYPNHTVDEILSLVKIDKVYNTSESCVVCMDNTDLVLMSRCKHQVSCMKCSLMNGYRCPMCRSEGNVILQMV